MKFFTVQKLEGLAREVRGAVYREVRPILNWKAIEIDVPGAQAPEFDDAGWRDFRVGDAWGGYDIVAWFRTHLVIPPEWRKSDGTWPKLALYFLVGPREEGNSTAETLLYVNGHPLQAVDRWHEEAWLPPEVVAAGEIDIALRAWSGVLEVPPVRHFRRAQLVLIDEGAERLAGLTDVLLRAVHVLPEGDLRRGMLVEALNRVYLGIDFGAPYQDRTLATREALATRATPREVPPRPQRFYDSVRIAARVLSAEMEVWQGLREVKPTITAIGHAHIDLAWLWRLRHSREKAGRTFSTALHLMRQYPEYCFMHSAPQAYKFLKQDYPEIFERVKACIADCRWEVTGGMWVEADTNLIGSESLVRQFLYGVRYVQDEFGVNMRVLWLPDVFGYSYALPQVAAQSGIRYFVTSKISWSQFNRFPYDTFRWRGLDGTELLTHFITTPEADSPGAAHTYNGQVTPGEIRGMWENYRQKDINDELLMLFGWGDGGGGPTREMLDRAEALHNLPGIPQVQLGRAEPFFDRLAERLHGEDVPVWDGELYLEIHRGTYTSQAFLKRANRKAEVLYHDAEWLNSMADVLLDQAAYPMAPLREGWEAILLHQFHDILPGSSIRQVYEDAAEAYERIEAIGYQTLAAALDRMAASVSTGASSLIVFNPLSWVRHDVVALPWDPQRPALTVKDEAGRPLPCQVVREGVETQLLVEVHDVPALGYRAYPVLAAPNSARPAEGEAAMVVTPERVENHFWRIELNRAGQIRSLYDKRAGREVLAPAGRPGSQGEPGEARANVFQAFEDKPLNFDAWDIDIFYQEKVTEINVLQEAVVEESGPVRGTVRLVWRYGDSTITQRLTIYGSSPRIDFRTEVDWWEQQVLLKVAFPVAVRSTRATYEIQWGSIERPTHWNTSWDYARFEVVGHKWADLSEGGYGVSLLNDCKYGHDIKGNTLRLTLIKSAVRPDAAADKGRHVFTYSLLPHRGDWRDGGTVHEAYSLNDPLLAALAPAQEGPLPPARSLVSVSADHVIVETVKRAEDCAARPDCGASTDAVDEETGNVWIVRVYDWQQRRSEDVRLTFGRPVKHAVSCNLVEEAEAAVRYEGNDVVFGVKPFEIKTFKVWL